MKRRVILTTTVLLSLLGWVTSASAQDDMTFSAEEMASPDQSGDSGDSDTGASDGGDMSFDVIDTEAEAAKASRDKAAENDLIRVIQRRPFLQAQRAEFAPMIGTNINDPLVNLFIAGGSLNYYISEYLAVGVHGMFSLGSDTDLFDKLIDDYELYPQVSKLKWVGELQFQYDPIYGKFTLFDTWIVPWDIYTLLGAGYTKTELDGHVTLAVGVGQRFYMNRWFTMNLELRDHIYNETYPGGSELVNNIVFTAGVGFFLPPHFEYKTLK